MKRPNKQPAALESTGDKIPEFLSHPEDAIDCKSMCLSIARTVRHGMLAFNLRMRIPKVGCWPSRSRDASSIQQMDKSHFTKIHHHQPCDERFPETTRERLLKVVVGFCTPSILIPL